MLTVRISRWLGVPGLQVRRASRSATRPNQGFQRLQEKLAALPAPEFGTIDGP